VALLEPVFTPQFFRADSLTIFEVPSDVAIPLCETRAPVQNISLIIRAFPPGNKELLRDISPELIRVAELGMKLAYAYSFQITYLITIAFGVTDTCFVAFSRNVDHQMTRHVDIKVLEGIHVRDRNDTGAHNIERS
jgi:hypothetical protein